MSFDERLAGLADRAASAHLTSDGFATDGLKARVRRGRRVRAAVAGAGAVLAVAVVGVAGVTAVEAWRDVPPVQTPEPTLAPTPTPTDSPDPDPSQDPTSWDVLQGWSDAGVDPDVFGSVSISGAVSAGGRAVVVGCATEAGTDVQFPAWASDDATGWVAASGPAPRSRELPCLDWVVATSHGFYAAGSDLYRSTDGLTWSVVDEPRAAGAALGRVDALMVVGDRVTAVVHHDAETGGQHWDATLWTTTDGVGWELVGDERARVFDDTSIYVVLPGPDGGAVALGADPGGEYIPTAVAWTSADGLTWTRTTPPGEGFDGCRMVSAAVDVEGYVAVGRCESVESGVVSWTSTDGSTWRAHGVSGSTEGELTGPGTVTSVPSGSGSAPVRFATGDGLEDGAEVIAPWPVMWRARVDGAWERLPDEVAVPFAVVEVGGRQVGFWPGERRQDEPVRVLVAD